MCSSVGSPALRSLTATGGRPGADDADLAGDSGADLGDEGRRHLGGGQREDVVRPGGETLGRLVGSDDDEQVHGDMLAH